MGESAEGETALMKFVAGKRQPSQQTSIRSVFVDHNDLALGHPFCFGLTLLLELVVP